MKNRKIGNVIKLAGNKYRIRISCGFDDFGKRIVIDKTIDAKNGTEAERELMRLYNNREEVRTSSAAPRTLGDLWNMFLNIHLKDKAPNTIEYYKNTWKHIEDFKNIKIEKLDINNINKILGPVPEGKRKYAAYKMLNTMISKAISWGYFYKINPCSCITAPQYSAKEKKVLTPEHIKIINETLTAQPVKYQCVFYLAAMLGMRRQEIVALSWNDINLKKSEIYIRNAASIQSGGGKTILKDTKTDKSKRKLFIPSLLLEKLKELRRDQLEAKFKLGDLWQDKNFVFTQWNGDIMSIYTPTAWWKKYAAQVGINEKITFHSLRHSAASVMIHSGIDIATVSRTLGHSNITTTLNTYTHLIEDSKKNAVLAASEMFYSAK